MILRWTLFLILASLAQPCGASAADICRDYSIDELQYMEQAELQVYYCDMLRGEETARSRTLEDLALAVDHAKEGFLDLSRKAKQRAEYNRAQASQCTAVSERIRRVLAKDHGVGSPQCL